MFCLCRSVPVCVCTSVKYANYISRPFSASVSPSYPPHPPVRRLDSTSLTHSACLVSLATPTPDPPPTPSIFSFFLVCFVCVPLLSSSSFPIRTIGYGTLFPAALLTGTSRHMPLGSAEGGEHSTVVAAHSMSAIWWWGDRTECTGRYLWEIGVHDLGSRWQISIQFVESRIEYLLVKMFFFSPAEQV